ncbi:hypothetical protein EAF00_010677 [Botryotinia globosa]|nr:hypothetical protein EAF00_010677 [Botryotinia globosa]
MAANSTANPAKYSVAAAPAGLPKYPSTVISSACSAQATKPTIAVTVCVTDYVSTTNSTTTTTASAIPSFVIAADTEKSQYVTYEDYSGLKILKYHPSPQAPQPNLSRRHISPLQTKPASPIPTARVRAPHHIFPWTRLAIPQIFH